MKKLLVILLICVLSSVSFARGAGRGARKEGFDKKVEGPRVKVVVKAVKKQEVGKRVRGGRGQEAIQSRQERPERGERVMRGQGRQQGQRGNMEQQRGRWSVPVGSRGQLRGERGMRGVEGRPEGGRGMRGASQNRGFRGGR